MSSRTTATHASLATLVSLAFASLGMASAHAGPSGSLALTSDYLFRGMSQTNQEAALQGGVEYAADGGLYAGLWSSNVSWLSDLSTAPAPISNRLELDGYAGYRGKLGDRAGFDVGALYYSYPGAYPTGFNSPDTGEIYVGVTAGIVSAKYSYALTDLFGLTDSEGSGYLDLSANWEFQPSWTLNLHGGRQWIGHNDAYEYTDWKLGVTKAFGSGLAVVAAYSDTNADAALYTNPHGRCLTEDTITLTVSKAF